MRSFTSFFNPFLAGPGAGLLAALLLTAAPGAVACEIPPAMVAASPTTFRAGSPVALTARPGRAPGVSDACPEMTTGHDGPPAALPTSKPTSLQRAAGPDPRPLVRLELDGQGGRDEFTAYAEADATHGFDGKFDAVKTLSSTGLNVSSLVDHKLLAIDARPDFADGLEIPLVVSVPAGGTYGFTVAELLDVPAGLEVTLRDVLFGHTTPLTARQYYGFIVTDAQAKYEIIGRFALVVRKVVPLGTAPAGLSAATVSLYPNPARDAFTVALPGVAGARAVQAELLSPLGQVVRRQQAALPVAGAQLRVATADLAPGLYMLRLTAGPATLTRRVVLE